MLCYYNVHGSKNRGKFSCFPEHHWVASSMIYTFYTTTLFQLSVKDLVKERVSQLRKATKAVAKKEP